MPGRQGTLMRTHNWTRIVTLLAAVVLLGGGMAVALGALGSKSSPSSPPPSLSRALSTSPGSNAAVEQSFVEAFTLQVNLGAPPPPGSSGSWALHSMPLRTGAGAPLLADAEHAWVGPTGRLELLSASEGSALIAQDTRDAEAVFTGALEQRVVRGMQSLVLAEEKYAAAISSPGGVAVLEWYSVVVGGRSARVHALVQQWNQEDRVVRGPGGTVRIVSSVGIGETDTYATLDRGPDGRWRVATLDPTPVGSQG